MISRMSNISENIEDIPFFFIIGRPRSGTTLLQTLFEAHPNVCIPPESAVIEEAYDRFKTISNWTSEELDEFIEFLFQIRRFEYWKINKKDLSTFLKSYAGEYTFNTLIKLVYIKYKSVFDKEKIEIFGDKNPRYSRYPEKIIKIFPEAKYIHLVRDYRDHILSMQRVKLLKSYLPLIAFRWRRSQNKMIKLSRNFPKSFYSIRYEDFVEKPEYYFEQICSFLQIQYSADIFNYRNQKEKFKKENKYQSDEEFHGNVFKPINANQVGKWEKEMDYIDVKKADYIVGKYAELSGYGRKYVKFSLLDHIRFLPDVLITYTHLISIGMILLIPVRLRKKVVKVFPNLSKKRL